MSEIIFEAKEEGGKMSDKDRIAELEEALSGMLFQFAYDSNNGKVPTLHSGGLSALGIAFTAMRWTDPYPIPESKCQTKGCPKRISCGISTPDGYKQLCGNCYGKESNKQEEK